ncbi:hypothetical protein TNCV_2090491 [Trichonephila clavipes]|nr:hypothetical protein TNCV_2090491 [Trichonephila clavipes]
MPGKRAKDIFTVKRVQERPDLSMKLQASPTRRVAARWIVRSVPLEIVGSSGHEKVHARKTGTFPKWSPRASFQQDNVRPHTARVAQDFLRHFQTLPWPGPLPDLCPVGARVGSAKTADAIVSLCT